MTRHIPDDIRAAALSMEPREARRYLREKLGLKKSQTNDLYRRLSDGSIAPDAPAKKPDYEVTVTTDKPQSLDEVVALCKVDLSKWEPKGFAVDQRKAGFAWRVSFKEKVVPIDAAQMLGAFIAHAAEHAPRKWALPIRDKQTRVKDSLYVLNIQDLHLCKLAFEAEAGQSYDIRIAEKVYRDAVKDLIAKAPVARIEEVLVIVGSDMLQVDNDHSTTTAGTYVDSDTRLSKAVDVATKMLTEVIEELATHFRVRVVVIPGNHDTQVSFFLGYYLSAWFRVHPNVVVDNGPKSRKYVGYGKTLIGFDHGDKTKLADLPLILMRENQATISQYRYLEVLTGHRHRDAVQEHKGVKVRTAPALCATDAWHFESGYVGNIRTSQGLLYNKEHGLEAIFYSTPLE